MAQAKGLSLVIANPLDKEFMNIKKASDVLTGNDKDARHYISHWAQVCESSGKGLLKTPEQKVYDVVLDGNREDIVGVIENALNNGVKAQTLLKDVMISAITKVGEMFDKKEYFLPQLIASAETMKKGFDFEPAFAVKS